MSLLQYLTNHQILLMLIFFVLFLVFYFTLELISRKSNFQKEYFRKAAHLITGIGSSVSILILEKWYFITDVSIFMLMFILSYYKKTLSSVHSNTRQTAGEIFYPYGFLLMSFIFYNQKNILIAGILIIAISDTLAWFVGKEIFNKQEKSNIGSLAFFTSTLLISLTLLPLTIPLQISLAILLTLVERLSKYYGVDNFTIPLAFSVFMVFF